MVHTNISARVVDDPCRLEKASGRLEIFPLPEDASVLQLCQALRRVESIDGPGEHQQLVLRQLLLHREVVDVQPDCDVLLVEQHLLKHGRIAVLGQSLKGFSCLLFSLSLMEKWGPGKGH